MKTTNIEILEIIAKPWATNKDIEVILRCSKSKANNVRQNIEKQIIAEGKKLPPIGCYIPMKRVVDFLELDEKRIIKLAKVEAEINAFGKTKIKGESQ